MVEWIVALYVAPFAIAFAADTIKVRRWKRQYGAAWAAYNANAFEPTLVPVPGKTVRIQRVADELISGGKRRAISVAHASGYGVAVHELRADGSFSDRGPYFIKLRGGTWSLTGRRHLILTEKVPGGFQASNPNGGTVTERGVLVLEKNTAKYAPVTLHEFVAMQRKAQMEVAA
jgi:hypothetical protein